MLLVSFVSKQLSIDVGHARGEDQLDGDMEGARKDGDASLQDGED